MGKRIFLSYQREDQAKAAQLGEQLKFLGHEVWIDQERLRAGRRWWDQILESLRQADVVVLAISPGYLEAEACQSEWRYALALQRTVVPMEVVAVDLQRVPSEIADIELVREGWFGKLVAAVEAAPATPLPHPMPDEPAQPLTWSKIIEVVRSAESVDDDTQFAVAVKLIVNLWSPSPDTPTDVYELAVEFLRRERLDTRARRILQAAVQPLSVSWPQVRRVVDDPASADSNTQVAVAVKLIENLWSPAPDAPEDVHELVVELLRREHLETRARRILQPAVQPLFVSWPQVRRVVGSPGSVDGNTQVAVAVKLIENLWSPAPDAPADVTRLAADLRSHNETDIRARRLLLAVLPTRRTWFPILGAALAGLALTHVFWVPGLYSYLNRVLGPAKGPITVNALLAMVGAVLCVVAWRADVKGARLGLVLCAVGLLATVVDAMKIGWIPWGWPF